MGVHILVVITGGKLSVLPFKAMPAEIVMAGRTHAVPPPIPEGTQYLVQQRIVRIHSTALSHGDMVRRIKAGCANISYSAGKPIPAIHRTHTAQSITVILYKP